MQNEQAPRQHWIWVTRPKYYLDKNGNDREDLDPSAVGDADGWWTCHQHTRAGDLAFLWRTRPKSDIGYLVEAKSDAYSLEDERYAVKQGWKFGCEYRVLYKFEHPVTFGDLKADPLLAAWGTVRGQMQGRVFQVPQQYWDALTQLAVQKNPHYSRFIEQNIEHSTISPTILLERHLEDRLAQNLALLRPFGYDLMLYVDPETGRSGRQFVCRGDGRRIDLLCYDQSKQRYVVVELKNVRAGYSTLDQIENYVDWVQRHIAKRQFLKRTPVIGLVISRGMDQKFRAGLAGSDQLRHLDINQLMLE